MPLLLNLLLLFVQLAGVLKFLALLLLLLLLLLKPGIESKGLKTEALALPCCGLAELALELGI